MTIGPCETRSDHDCRYAAREAFVFYGDYDWPSYSEWLIPGTSLED